MPRCLLVLGACVLWAQTPSAETFTVSPDGGGDYPTIQAAVFAAEAGDVIFLADGTFTGDGNRDVNFQGRAITVRSASGDPETCVIECEGSASAHHRAFVFQTEEDEASVIEGITIRGGYHGWGGAIFCGPDERPEIRGCVFRANRASSFGGAIYCGPGASPQILSCIFQDNEADAFGGALYGDGGSDPLIETSILSRNSGPHGGALFFRGANPMLDRCTLTGNGADYGGGIYCNDKATVLVNQSIIAFGSAGEAVYDDGLSTATLTGCDVHGNAGGDWVGAIDGQDETGGNLAVDPQFCSPEPDDHQNWRLQSDSPCVSEAIGACGAGCGISPARSSTWSAIKARFSSPPEGSRP